MSQDGGRGQWNSWAATAGEESAIVISATKTITTSAGWDFAWCIVGLLDADGASITCVNRAGVVFNCDKLPLVVKDGPVLLQQSINPIANGGVEVQKVKLLSKFGTVVRLVVMQQKTWINIVYWRGWMFAPTEDGTTLDVVEDDIKLMGLVGISAVV